MPVEVSELSHGSRVGRLLRQHDAQGVEVVAAVAGVGDGAAAGGDGDAGERRRPARCVAAGSGCWAHGSSGLCVMSTYVDGACDRKHTLRTSSKPRQPGPSGANAGLAFGERCEDETAAHTGFFELERYPRAGCRSPAMPVRYKSMLFRRWTGIRRSPYGGSIMSTEARTPQSRPVLQVGPLKPSLGARRFRTTTRPMCCPRAAPSFWRRTATRSGPW